MGRLQGAGGGAEGGAPKGSKVTSCSCQTHMLLDAKCNLSCGHCAHTHTRSHAQKHKHLPIQRVCESVKKSKARMVGRAAVSPDGTAQRCETEPLSLLCVIGSSLLQ